MGRQRRWGAKFRISVLSDLRNRGLKDVFFIVCDGLKGLPEVVADVWPLTIVQTIISPHSLLAGCAGVHPHAVRLGRRQARQIAHVAVEAGLSRQCLSKWVDLPPGLW